MLALCITLDSKNKKRAKKAYKSIKKLGFKNIEMVPGVKGENIPDIELKRLLTPRAYHELKNGRYVHEGISGKGSIGCFLAHFQCWSRVSDGGDGNFVAIFEDDFEVKPELIGYFKKAMKDAIKNNFEILRLSHRRNKEIPQEINNITDNISKINRGESLAAYIITPEGAKKLMKRTFPICCQVDHYIDMLSSNEKIKQYSLNKDIFKDNKKESNINHSDILTYKGTLSFSMIKKHWIFIILVLILIFTIVYCMGKRR